MNILTTINVKFKYPTQLVVTAQNKYDLMVHKENIKTSKPQHLRVRHNSLCYCCLLKFSI